MRPRVQERFDRWIRFVEDGTEPFMFIVNYPNGVGERPFPNHNYAERIDWAARTYEADLHHIEKVTDDLVPCLRTVTGTEVFAEAFGCPVERPEDHMPYARPMINVTKDISGIRVPDPFDTPLAKLFEIAEALRERFGSDALMKLPDIQSPMGIAALILDKSAFLTALIDEPAAVRDLAGMTMELLTTFLDEWYRRYGTDYAAHHPDYCMRRGVTLSEDEIGSVSNAMFEEFFLPDLISLSRRYGALGIHCCADCRHHWSSLLKIPDLLVLNLSTNWLQEPDITCRDAYQFFAGKLAQYHRGREFEGEPWTWPDQVPPNARPVLTIPAESENEATAIAARLSEIRENRKHEGVA